MGRASRAKREKPMGVNVLALQNQSRERLFDAVKRWQALAGATANDQSWAIEAPNRDGVPCVVEISLKVRPK